jgi:hypothetical protein
MTVEEPGGRQRWVVLRTCASGIEGETLAAVLRAHGIPARVDYGNTTGLFGPMFQGPSALGVELLVPEPRADEAWEILATGAPDGGDVDESGD